MKNVCVLGSTGSIGKSALEVISKLPQFRVFGIACYQNTTMLMEQARKFNPNYICILNSENYVKNTLSMGSAKILVGEDEICELATHPEVDIVLNAFSGVNSVKFILETIKSNKRLAIANKETLVSYGEIIMKTLARSKAELLPVDSEHSAIHQCLHGFNNTYRKEEFNAPNCDACDEGNFIKNIILTATGGPFLNTEMKKNITSEQALQHPVWRMGEKITIDSASLMNKGFEVIEASILFKVPHNKIKIVIHPQAVIHSMVEFVDNSILAQLGIPDMKLPIQYALTYPDRMPSLANPIDFEKIGKFEFSQPDFNKFPCIGLAYESLKIGGTMPAVLNSADDFAVKSFLSDKIKFHTIAEIIAKVMEKHKVVSSPSIEEIDCAIKWAKEEAEYTMSNMMVS